MTELVLGRKYNVPCISCYHFDTGKHYSVPVFGPAHIDGPELYQEERIRGKRHIHIDYRFCDMEEMLNFGRRSAIIIDKKMPDLYTEYRTYWRKWHFTENADASLIEKYRDCKLTNHRCPHQGLDLSTIDPVMVEGRRQIVCPGHLLKWCADSGKMLVPKT